MADEPTKAAPPPLVTDELAAALIKDLIAQVSTVQPFMLVEAFRLLGVEYVSGQYTPRELIVDAGAVSLVDGTRIGVKVAILPVSHTWPEGKGGPAETTLRDATVAAMATPFPTPGDPPAEG